MNTQQDQIQNEQTDKPQLFKVREALKYTGGAIGRDSFYQMLRSGAIPSIRAGNRYIIPKKGLDKFLEGQQ